jgi:hypothetical protein
MRNHRIVTLLSAAAITAASGLAVAPSAHAEGAIVKLVSAESGKCLQPGQRVAHPRAGDRSADLQRQRRSAMDGRNGLLHQGPPGQQVQRSLP